MDAVVAVQGMATATGIVLLAFLSVPGVVALTGWARGLWRASGDRTRERRADATQSRAVAPHLTFLVPAHNEELLIAACVRSLVRQRYSNRRIIVIADNCTDATVSIARHEGAEVFERHDLELPGKPYALAWAIDRVGVHGTDAFVVVDADTEVAPDYAQEIASIPDLRNVAAQTYFGIANENETALTRLAGVLTRMRYDLEFPARARAGLNVPLTGNGMVLGASLMRRRPWRAFSVSEDWELYAEYTATGERIEYIPRARLFSQEANSTQEGASQRARWQEGRREVRRLWGPAILHSRKVSLLQKVDALTLLWLPSPVVHVALSLAGAALLAIGGVGLLPIALWLGVANAADGVRAVMALTAQRDPLLTLGAATALPSYAIWRLWVGVRARTSRAAKSEWVRTRRHAYQDVAGDSRPD